MRISRLRFVIPVMLVGTCLGLISPLAGQNKKQEADALLAKARELSDIRCEGCPPFKLRGKIRLTFPWHPPTEGAYLLIWRSPKSWREHTRISNQERILVREGERFWESATPKYGSFLTLHCAGVMNIGRDLRIQPSETLRRMKTRVEGAVSLSCIDTKREGGEERTLCFDAKNSALLSSEYSGMASDRRQFSNYGPAGGKMFPHSIEEFYHNSLVATATVEEWENASESDLSLIAPPPGGITWPICEGPIERAKLLKQTRPTYPPSALERGIAGKVRMHVVIDLDGRPHDLTVLSSTHPDLSKAAVDSVRQWEYEPTVCNGEPVPVVTEIDVNFNLR